jgi:hypothetical protein
MKKFHTFNFKDTRYTIISKDDIDSKVAYNLAALHHIKNPEIVGPITILTTTTTTTTSSSSSSSAAADILQQFAESLQNQE